MNALHIRMSSSLFATSAIFLCAALIFTMPTRARAVACGLGTIVGSNCVIFLTSGTSFTVPSTWDSSNNTIEVIGGGGSGQHQVANHGGAGGGGGGYSKVSNVSLTPGASVTYAVGAAGARSNPGGAGGDTYFCNSSSNCASIAGSAVVVGAKGGGGGSSGTGGTGGAAASGVGTVKYSGGNGGSVTSGAINNAGGGGGGAAGPRGNGGNGGTVTSTETGGSGGGGAGGGGSGTNGSDGAYPGTVNGGAGGNNAAGTGGAAENSGTTNAGTNGGGGSGGRWQAGGAATGGGTGGSGTDWDSTHGAGGGGGGAGEDSGGGAAAGGNGGSYGGGSGGAASYGNTTSSAGAPGQGIIVITYAVPAGYHTDITLSGNVKFLGDLAITGALSKGSGTFEIDHPQFPHDWILRHSFVESPDAKNIYNGTAVFNSAGEAAITLPDYFDALNKSVRYQFFALGQAMPDLHIKEEEKDNRFVIGGGMPGGKVSWQVTGVRHDPYILAHPIIVEVLKGPGQPVGRGECLFEPLCQ